jgi:RNA polymerase sigma-70 factor (ECF subfamily)
MVNPPVTGIRWEPNAPDPVSETVRLAQRGDHAAFRALYEAHVGRIHALCLRLTGSAAEAEEYTQSAFVRAWQRLETFRGDSAFGTWLHRLAVNEVMQARRSAPPVGGGLPEAMSCSRGWPAARNEQDQRPSPGRGRQIFVLYDIRVFSRGDRPPSGVAEGHQRAASCPPASEALSR